MPMPLAQQKRLHDTLLWGCFFFRPRPAPRAPLPVHANGRDSLFNKYNQLFAEIKFAPRQFLAKSDSKKGFSPMLAKKKPSRHQTPLPGGASAPPTSA